MLKENIFSKNVINKKRGSKNIINKKKKGKMEGGKSSENIFLLLESWPSNSFVFNIRRFSLCEKLFGPSSYLSETIFSHLLTLLLL